MTPNEFLTILTIFLQIIALSERLTESDAGCEGQLDINRKREAEMAKLRKLLEDVHMESEQNIHILRKKHQVLEKFWAKLKSFYKFLYFNIIGTLKNPKTAYVNLVLERVTEG